MRGYFETKTKRLVARLTELAKEYGRYGYRRITALLNYEGWNVNHKHIERIWRSEGLKVPKKQPKRRRLWFNEGSCIRLRPNKPNNVWSYDFIMNHLSNGKLFKMLTVIDEFTRESLAIVVGFNLGSDYVQECLKNLFIDRAIPEHIRADNGAEFTAENVRGWVNRIGVRTLFIEPGSPWENGYIESFHSKFRDELIFPRKSGHNEELVVV